MDKPNASLPWASSQYLMLEVAFISCLIASDIFLGSSFHPFPRALWWKQTGSLILGPCRRHAVPT